MGHASVTNSPVSGENSLEPRPAPESEREPTPDSSATPVRFGVVNGLRGVAILAVMYHHLCEPFLTPFGTGLRKMGRYVYSTHSPLYNGRFGVALFFILSGFVLVLPYERGVRTMTGPRDAWAYYVRRFKRLIPLYYFILLITLFVQSRARWPYMGTPMDVLRFATFTFIYTPEQFLPTFNPALWSLAVEVHFSLLLPLLLWMRRKVGISALTAGVFVLSFLVRYYATSGRGALLPTPIELVKDGPFGRLDDFVLGMLICDLSLRGRLPRGIGAFSCIVLGTLLVLFGGVVWDNVIFGLVKYTVAAWAHDLLTLGFGLVFIGFLGSTGWLRRIISLSPLQLFGMMCYSLYAWHTFGLTLRGIPWPVKELPYVLVITVLLSAVTYRYVEFPEKSWKSLFLEFPR